MNILAYAPQMAVYGGMERHVCDLAGVLSARGHRVTLLTTSNSLGPEMRAGLAARQVQFHELAERRGRAGAVRKGFWLLREALREDRTRWDIIYTNGQSGLAQLAWLPAKPHTRIIHHHHTAADAREQATWSGSFRRVLQRAAEIVACSRTTQEALERALGRQDIRFLPYLTRPIVAAPAVAERPAGRAPLHFGYLGRLVAEKGMQLICQLSQLDELADVVWHIHGAGPKYPPSFFQPYPRIVYHGPFASGAQHAAILQQLDAAVLFSSHNEGMPLSLIEAMAAGLPWIATARGGTRELALSADNCIVLDRADLPAATAAVREMADRLRRGLPSRRAQREVYDRHFSPATAAALWSDYFEAPQAASLSA